MKKRWIFLPLIALFVIGLIFGSIFDLQINSAIYDRTNGFGLFMAAFGECPVYAFMGTIGFGYLFLCKDYKKWWQRLILIVLCVAALAICTYFQGKHIFDINAFYTTKTSIKLLGYALGLLIGLLGACAGYFLLRNSKASPKKILFVLVFLTLVIGVAVGLNQITKSLMSRPRYRFLDNNDMVGYFKNWWESGKALKEEFADGTHYDAVTGVLISKEEFKSFPSGHMTNTMTLLPILAMLPVLNDKIKLREEILISIGLTWNLILAYSRMRVGAHFLSDVCMGSLFTIIVWYVLNEIYRALEKKIMVVPVSETANE